MGLLQFRNALTLFHGTPCPWYGSTPCRWFYVACRESVMDSAGKSPRNYDKITISDASGVVLRSVVHPRHRPFFRVANAVADGCNSETGKITYIIGNVAKSIFARFATRVASGGSDTSAFQKKNPVKSAFLLDFTRLFNAEGMGFEPTDHIKKR